MIILFLLHLANFGLASEAKNCSPATDILEPLWTVVYEFYDPKDQLCNDLKLLDRTGQDRTPNNSPLCSTLWPDNKPWWLNQIKNEPGTLDKASPSYVNKSKKEMLAAEYRYATKEDMLAMKAEFNKYLSEQAQNCCGTDSYCEERFKMTKLVFCDDPDATDENKPDKCSGSNEALFTRDKKESFTYYWNLNNNEEYRTKPDVLDFLNKNPIYRLELENVATGFVSISKYLPAYQTGLKQYTILHELGHACSSIRQQILALKKTNYPAINSEKELCEPNPKHEAQMIAIDNMINDEEYKNISDCLKQEIDKSSKDKSSYSYTEKFCFWSKFEEGAAIVYSLLATDDNNILDVTGNVCNSAPNKIHPGGYQSFECVMKHSIRVRRLLMRKLHCN